MTQFITKLNVSTDKDEEEVLRGQGYQLLNVDLNEGAGGNRVFLWYKKECGIKPVTRVQFTFNSEMKTGLAEAGYELVNRDLNAGVEGDHIFLWYFCGSTKWDIPIVNLKISRDAEEEPALLNDGWERLGCDLNRNAGGCFIYLWVKRATPSSICDITASVDFGSDKQLFELGYTRVDENVNRAAGGSQIFLWYRRSVDINQGLAALDVSITPQEQVNLQARGFKKLSIDLNKGTQGNEVFVWHLTRGSEAQIQTIAVLINPAVWKAYEKNGIIVLNQNLNEGNCGWKMYLAYKKKTT